MPAPRTNESKDDFISRCIPIVLDEGTADDSEQAVAVCNSMWEEREVKETVREYAIGEFRGDFPDIPFAPGVNVEELRTLDDDPMFVTLPIVPKVGAVSRNGLLYDEALVDSIAEQINSRRPGAGMGHIKDEERSSAYPIPEGFWVGAQRVGETLWGKAYVPKGQAREHFRTLKAIGGQIATSIYGKGKYEKIREGVRRLRDFDLETLDFAPPGRAALGYAANPIITAEMENKEGDGEMPTKDEIIAELTARDVPATVREQIIQDHQAQNQDTQRIGELEGQIEDRDQVIETLREQLQQMQVREFEAALDDTVAEYVKFEARDDDGKKKVESLRRMFRARLIAELGDERDEDKLQTVAESVWKDEMKVIAETVRDALAGPPARVSGKVRGRVEIDDTPEARRRARAAAGF